MILEIRESATIVKNRKSSGIGKREKIEIGVIKDYKVQQDLWCTENGKNRDVLKHFSKGEAVKK